MPSWCSVNASQYCPWDRMTKPLSNQLLADLRQRPCPGNALGVSGLHELIQRMAAYQQQVNPQAVEREGGSPLSELESWLRSPTAAESPQRICEIGLNGGESAAAWLCAFPQASYRGFDLARFNVTLTAAAFLQRAFPGRSARAFGHVLHAPRL